MRDTIKACFISTFSPTQCGIATYTEDLMDAMKGTSAHTFRVLYDHDACSTGNCIELNCLGSYEKASSIINDSDAELVSLQHEFSIYGGTGGVYVLQLVDQIKKPIVTTFHTIKRDLRPDKQEIIKRLTVASKRVVVLTAEAARLLTDIYKAPSDKIVVIPHGIPEVEFQLPLRSRLRQQQWPLSSVVFVSAGHRRPSKGYHVALEALAEYRKVDSAFKYVIVGTHQRQFPELAGYRDKILDLVDRLKLTENVIWVDRYLDRSELLQYICAADVGLVTYTVEDENASGVLPLLLGCGRVVIATAFQCAISMKQEVDSLILTDLNSPSSITAAICKVGADVSLRTNIMWSNFNRTRKWLWPEVAEQYRRVFARVASGAY